MGFTRKPSKSKLSIAQSRFLDPRPVHRPRTCKPRFAVIRGEICRNVDTPPPSDLSESREHRPPSIDRQEIAMFEIFVPLSQQSPPINVLRSMNFSIWNRICAGVTASMGKRSLGRSPSGSRVSPKNAGILVRLVRADRQLRVVADDLIHADSSFPMPGLR